MSEDGTIQVIKLWCGSKISYMVIYVQAAENFADYSYFLWYLVNGYAALKYTTSPEKAMQIAKKMLKD